jgi:hypothetical protein
VGGQHAGRLDAPLWEKVEYRSPLRVARRVALCFVSAAAQHVAVAGDESRAEVSYRWPDEGWLEFSDLSRQEIQMFSRFFAPIAEHLGLWFAAALTFAREPVGVPCAG